MDVHRQAVLEREAPVARDVICVRVRLEHADEPDIATSGLREQRLDRIGRVDRDGDAIVLVAHEVGGAAEIVVHELREDHAPTVAAVAAISPKALRAPVNVVSAPP